MLAMAIATLVGLGACGGDNESPSGHQVINTDIQGTGPAALAEAVAVCNDTPGTDSVDVMGASGALLARRGAATGDQCQINDRYAS